MILARTAQGLYETHKMEIKHKRENNLLEEGEITALNELVAIDMEIDIKSVEKYKMLLKLIPELQEMADSGDYSWSALTTAATLDEQQQKRLEAMIREKTEAEGVANVTRAWIVDVSNRLKLEQSIEDVKKVQDDAPKKQNTRIRRKNGTKVIMNCAKNLHEVLDKDLSGLFQRLLRMDRAVGSDLQIQFFIVGLLLDTVVLDRVFHVLDRREDRIDRKRVDIFLRRSVLLRRHITATLTDSNGHLHLSAGSKMANYQLRVQDLEE